MRKENALHVWFLPVSRALLKTPTNVYNAILSSNSWEGYAGAVGTCKKSMSWEHVRHAMLKAASPVQSGILLTVRNAWIVGPS